MKRISLLLFVFALGLGLSSIQAQENAKSIVVGGQAAGAIAEFNETTVDYGTIEQNSDPLRTFTIKNTGVAPLVITAAKGSCGCTVPSYDKEPILPGQESEIQVRYDTKRVGNFNKTVTLTTNATNGTSEDKPGVFTLKIKGKVNAVEAVDAPTSIPATPVAPE